MLKSAPTLLALSTAVFFVTVLPPLAAQTFTNPVFSAADPWIAHENGVYYFSGGCHENSICVRSATTLEGLREGEWHIVFTAPAVGPNNSDIWAPEIHRVNGRWYIYYAADPNHDNNLHRLFVAQADTDDPLGHYSMGDTGAPNGQIAESLATWGIDPDVFTAADGKLYLTWSCADLKDPRHPQDICLARLRDPLHLDSDTSRIALPLEPWETRSAPIIEGPVGYTRGGHTFITYSGSASWKPNDYSVGLLTHTAGDMLSPVSWSKSGPIFDHHDTAYGAGSVVFIQAPNGEWWNFYHGIDRLDCNPAYACRDIRMQPMQWESNGAPRLGYPYDPGVRLPEPSLNLKTSSAPWGPAYGDAAEGNEKAGLEVGQWSNRSATENESLSLGPQWMQTFLRANPNIENYTLSAELQLIGTGEASTAPRYGVYAAYSDTRNFASVWIDPDAKTVSTYGVIEGALVPWAECQLPDSFNAQRAHLLSVRKTADVFQITMNGAPLTGACNARHFALLNGQIGLLTEDARVRYRNITVR